MGRGRSKTSGGATGGLSEDNIVNTTSLVSEREGFQTEVDAILDVAKDVSEQYGITAVDLQVATLKGRSARSTLAYYDSSGNLAINKNYFDSGAMDKAYDSCIKQGFHPGRGNKSGLEATAAHEMGHRLTDVAGQRKGYGMWSIDKVSNEIVSQAKQRLGAKTIDEVKKGISGYGQKNNAEAIAEAFSDVYCNGRKASRSSRAVVSVLNEFLGR